MDQSFTDGYRRDNLDDHLFVRVFCAKCVTIGRQWNYRDLCSGYWRLYWNDAPGASIELADGARYELTARRVHLIPAWVRFSCHNTGPVEHHYVHFEIVGVTATTLRRLFTKPFALSPDPHTDALAAAVRAPTAQAETVCRTKAAVYAALAAALAALPADEVLMLTAPAWLVPALRRIEENPGGDHGRAELAQSCHMSEDHFGRLFLQRVGSTPAQYVLERRIAAAAQDLLFTNDSIEQIADRLGFANRYHLTRAFTRRVGIPPAAYRRTRHA